MVGLVQFNYRASLPEGWAIAVRRLNRRRLHGDWEFLSEMGTVGKIKRENLVPLLGCCILQDERFLAYECMENGSLDVWLRNRAVAVEALDWPTRFKICLGSARGLAFLRHDFFLHIIRRDINPSNIFFNSKFEPWVAIWLAGWSGWLQMGGKMMCWIIRTFQLLQSGRIKC